MGILRQGIDRRSGLAGPLGPNIAWTPHTDFGGLVDDADGVAFGSPILFTFGSHIASQTTDNAGCVLKMPMVPVITLAANASTITIQVAGLDQFGRKANAVWRKTNASRQTQSAGSTAFSQIDSAIVTASSAPTARLRIGYCYGTYSFSGTDLATAAPTAANEAAVRGIPLPMPISQAGDILGSYPLHQLDRGIVLAAATTFTTTTGVFATWDPATKLGSATPEGYYAFTSDGYVGRISAADDAADSITVDAWVSRLTRTAGTPANGSRIMIYRCGNGWFSGAATAGALPGVIGATSAYAATLEPVGFSIDGIDDNADTVGIYMGAMTLTNEPVAAIPWEILYRPTTVA